METKRLILRHWKEDDAKDLFFYASDPEVGPIAGWPPHKDLEESLNVIRNVFTGREDYAICLKEDGKAIGAITLKLDGHSDFFKDRDDECELGYWLGKPFWGKGIMTEAAKEMIRHAFEDLHMNKVWCAYYDGNERSKRVQEKCGFRYQWTSEGIDVPLMNEKRTGHVNLLTREEWLADKGLVMEEKKDIFDRIMELPVLRIFGPIYRKYKTLLVYLFLGGCAAIVGFATRYLFVKAWQMNSYLGIALSWLLTTTFAFFTNRTWIFEHNDAKILSEYLKFCSGRVFTFFLDEVINGIFYEGLKWNFYVVFVMSSAIEAIINFLISKFFVFKK